MTECSDLHRGDRNLLAEARPTILRERTPSMDEVSCKFEVGPRHCAQYVLMAAWLSVARCATIRSIEGAEGQPGKLSAHASRRTRGANPPAPSKIEILRDPIDYASARKI